MLRFNIVTSSWHHHYVILWRHTVWVIPCRQWIRVLEYVWWVRHYYLEGFQLLSIYFEAFRFLFLPVSHFVYALRIYLGLKIGPSDDFKSPEIPDFKKNGETILSDSRSFSFSIPTDWTSWFFCWVKIDIFTSSWGIVFTFYRSTQFWLAEKMWRILIGWPMRKKLDLFLFFKFAKSKKSILHLTTNEL